MAPDSAPSFGDSHARAEGGALVSLPIRILGALIPALLVLVPAWVLILGGALDGRGAHDQLNYHEPAIVKFAAEWPRPNTADYLSATSPGYHLALAAAAQVLGHERVTLQLLASLFSAGLFGLVGFIACGRLGVRRTVVLMLPLAGSMYLFYPAVWLLPDNAAWLGVVAVVWMSLRWRVGVLSLIGVMAVTGALVYARQIHLWVLAPVWTAAYLGPREGGSRGNVERSELLAWDMPSLFKGEQLLGLGRVGVAMAAAALPCGILAVLVREWGGLTPPFFQGAYHGGNTAAPAFVLSLFALFAPWYAVFVWGRLARTMSGGRVGMVIGAALGLAFALASPSTYSTEAGRYSGLWNITRSLPEIGDRSVLILMLSPVGGACVMGMLGMLGRRDRWVMAATLVGFIAAQSASHELWQRYTEPFVLLYLTLMCVLVAGERGREGQGAGPGTLAQNLPLTVMGLALAALTCVSIARARPVKDLGLTADPKYAVPGWSFPAGSTGGP
jgi:ABC-type amino acid transport system permease subunit